jgi:hypothetical protein
MQFVNQQHCTNMNINLSLRTKQCAYVNKQLILRHLRKMIENLDLWKLETIFEMVEIQNYQYV